LSKRFASNIPRRHGQRKRWSSNQNQDGSHATEHQLLRHQFRTRLGLAAVHPSVQPQPLANRYSSHPPENARPFTSLQSDLLIGWSPLRPIPVNSTPLLVAMCPAILHGEYEPTSVPRYSARQQDQHAKSPRHPTISRLTESLLATWQILMNLAKLADAG